MPKKLFGHRDVGPAAGKESLRIAKTREEPLRIAMSHDKRAAPQSSITAEAPRFHLAVQRLSVSGRFEVF